MKNLLSLLRENIQSGQEDVALLFSGGIDSAVVYNLLKERLAGVELYSLKMDGVESDDYKSFVNVSKIFATPNITIPISEDADLSEYKKILISKGIPKNKPASLLVMSLFCYCLKNIKQDIVYTGLGSDAFYGLGRNFSIKCSLKGEKIPSLKSMNEFREKTYSHYMQQYIAIQSFALDNNKKIISPFMSKEIFEFFQDKTFKDCNKPQKKQILIDLYPDYFNNIKPRQPSNMHCGNSEFKKIKLTKCSQIELELK